MSSHKKVRTGEQMVLDTTVMLDGNQLRLYLTCSEGDDGRKKYRLKFKKAGMDHWGMLLEEYYENDLEALEACDGLLSAFGSASGSFTAAVWAKSETPF